MKNCLQNLNIFSNISYDVLSYLKNKSLKFQLISEETKKENLYLFHFSTYTMKGSLAKWRVRDVDETKVSIPITRVLTSIVSTLLSIPHWTQGMYRLLSCGAGMSDRSTRYRGGRLHDNKLTWPVQRAI